jgi:lipopolysaccharide export system protein LptA
MPESLLIHQYGAVQASLEALVAIRHTSTHIDLLERRGSGRLDVMAGFPRTLAALALGVGVSAGVAGGTALADPLPGLGGEAVEIRADQIEVDVPGGTAVLTGHVTLVKGALKVECPRIDVRYDDAPRVTWAKGSGGVSADIRGVHAEAPEVELDLGRHVLELRGGVRLTRGQGWLAADRASIETTTAKVTLKDVKGSIPVALPRP